MRVASICSGIGVAESAWMPLGWNPVFFSEIEPFPCAELAHRYPDIPNLGDMTAINGDEWRGKVDLLAGGTPCQAFSIAGNRKSLSDERGNLTLKFVELCDAIDPTFVVWENVPGVLSTKDNAFGCFLGALAGEDGPLVAPGEKWTNAGYVLGPKRAIAWRVLDAQYFGVAQRRRRVFLVACPRDGADPRTILFESDGMRRDTPPSREKGKDIAGTLEASLGRSRGAGTPVSAIAVTGVGISSHWEGGPHPSLSQSHNTGGIGMSNQELFSPKGAGLVAHKWPAEVAPTLNAAFGSKMGLEDQHALGGAGLFVPHVSPPLTTSPYSDNAAEEGKLVVHYAQKFRCGECGEVFEDKYATGVGTLAPAECPRCGEEENVSECRAVTQYGDIAGSLTALHDSSPCADRGMNVVAIHPHCIGRAPTSGPQGKEYLDDGSAYTIDSRGVAQAVVFQQNQLGELRTGDVAGTLNTNSNPSGRNTPMVAIGWPEELTAHVDVAATLQHGGQGGRHDGVMQPDMQVRRLTPRECERLQGLPDDYTLVPVKKVRQARIASPKVNADGVKRYVEINGEVWQLAADGPRYKALGNAWNRAVVEWLGKRIDNYVKSPDSA